MKLNKILTKNPDKTMEGRNIDKENKIKKAIINSLKGKELTHTQLQESVRKKLLVYLFSLFLGFNVANAQGVYTIVKASVTGTMQINFVY